MAKKYSVKLLRKEELAKDTWLFAFEKPEGYMFVAGQYQTFTLSLSNGKTDWRDMTITSSPEHNELWLVTKMTSKPSEFKSVLDSLPIGSVISLDGPSGGFTLREEVPHIFLAGGIGINVFHSILMNAAEKNAQLSMTLFASFSTKQDMLFYDELRQIENGERRIIYTLTKEDWEGEKGRITDTMIKKYITSFMNAIFMVAGPEEFVDAMYEILVGMGIDKEKIRIDYFTGY